jgi:hypothetical protein
MVRLLIRLKRVLAWRWYGDYSWVAVVSVFSGRMPMAAVPVKETKKGRLTVLRIDKKPQ